jgi:hypothetical protein
MIFSFLRLLADSKTLPGSIRMCPLKDIKQIVKKVLKCFHFLPQMATAKNGNFHNKSPQYKDHFGRVTNKPTRDFPVKEQGRLMVGGWDFMVDRDFRTWLLEVNAICNLKNASACELDTTCKRLLAADIYTLLIDPTVNGSVPSAIHLQRLEL